MKLNNVQGVVASAMAAFLMCSPVEAGAVSTIVRSLPKIESPVARVVSRNTTLADRAFVSNVAEKTAFSRVYASTLAPPAFPALSTKITSQALNASDAMAAASRATAAKSTAGALKSAVPMIEKEAQATRVLAKTPLPKPVVPQNTASTGAAVAQVNKMTAQQQSLRQALGAPGPASQQAGVALHQSQMEAQRILTQAQRNAANARQRLRTRSLERARARGRWKAAQEANLERFEERQLAQQEQAATKMTEQFKDVRDPGVVYIRKNPNAAEGAKNYYIGQSKNSTTYKARRDFHDAKVGVKHEYEVVAIAKPGKDLSFAEESAMRAAGMENLLNKRVQIAPKTYESLMGGFAWAK